MYLDFKEKKSTLSNLFCLMVGPSLPSLIYSFPSLPLLSPSPSPISLMVTVGIHVHLFRAFCSSISISQADTFFSSELYSTEVQKRSAAQFISGIHLSFNALIFIEFSFSSGSDNVVGGLRM